MITAKFTHDFFTPEPPNRRIRTYRQARTAKAIRRAAAYVTSGCGSCVAGAVTTIPAIPRTAQERGGIIQYDTAAEIGHVRHIAASRKTRAIPSFRRIQAPKDDSRTRINPEAPRPNRGDAKIRHKTLSGNTI